MKVLKFGGSSVGSKESITNLKQIVESQQDDVIVVVSALGGITDKLIATAKMAASGDRQYETETNAMLERHEQMIRQILESEIVAAYYYQAGSIESGLRNDKQLQEAIRLLKHPDEYQKLLAPQKTKE